MNHLYCGDNLNVLRRYGTVITVILSCSQCLANDQAFGFRELAALVKPCVPHGWTVSVKAEEVVLERGQPIEIYNSIAMPGFRQKEEIQRRMRKCKLAISLRVAKPMEQVSVRGIHTCRP